MLCSVASILLVCTIVLAVGRAARPPKEIPLDLRDRYTVNGTVGIESFYVDDTNAGKETHFVFSEKSMNSYVKGIRKSFLKVMLMDTRAKLEGSELDTMHDTWNVQKADWIFFAMYKYSSSFKDKSVVVFGSSEPTYEAAALSLEAEHVTTVEYNNLTYAHPNVTTISKYQFSELYACNGQYQNSFDVAVSISSFDHDGLGRYGDPLDPEGDLKAMANAMSVLKPGGLMLLTVPIGPDLVVFNLLRRYGAVRLPMLLSGWEVVEKMFWEENKLIEPAQNYRRSYEPVLILRKPLDYVSPPCGGAAFEAISDEIFDTTSEGAPRLNDKDSLANEL